jgi:hypothetical protein
MLYDVLCVPDHFGRGDVQLVRRVISQEPNLVQVLCLLRTDKALLGQAVDLALKIVGAYRLAVLGDHGLAVGVELRAVDHLLVNADPFDKETHTGADEDEEPGVERGNGLVVDLRKVVVIGYFTPVARFAPVLAERAALLLWRLGLIARYEREAIALDLEHAEARKRPKLEDAEQGITNAQAAVDFVECLQTLPPEANLDSTVAARLLETAADAVGVDIFDGKGGWPMYVNGLDLDNVNWTTKGIRPPASRQSASASSTTPPAAATPCLLDQQAFTTWPQKEGELLQDTFTWQRTSDGTRLASCTIQSN